MAEDTRDPLQGPDREGLTPEELERLRALGERRNEAVATLTEAQRKAAEARQAIINRMR